MFVMVKMKDSIAIHPSQFGRKQEDVRGMALAGAELVVRNADASVWMWVCFVCLGSYRC